MYLSDSQNIPHIYIYMYEVPIVSIMNNIGGFLAQPFCTKNTSNLFMYCSRNKRSEAGAFHHIYVFQEYFLWQLYLYGKSFFEHFIKVIFPKCLCVATLSELYDIS